MSSKDVDVKRTPDWGSNYTLPKGYLKDAMQHIFDLMQFAVGKDEAKVYEHYIIGWSLPKIAKKFELDIEQVRRTMINVDEWLLEHLSKDRLRTLFQIPKSSVEGGMLECLAELCSKNAGLNLTNAGSDLAASHPPKMRLIESLDVSTRTQNVLHSAKITTIDELTAHTRKQLVEFRGSGAKTVTEIEQALSKIDCQLAS